MRGNDTSLSAFVLVLIEDLLALPFVLLLRQGASVVGLLEIQQLLANGRCGQLAPNLSATAATAPQAQD